MNKNTFNVFVTNGKNHRSNEKRAEFDYYATDPNAIDYLLKYQDFSDEIWECACGEKHLSNRLEEYGKNVLSSDIVARCEGIQIIDFLTYYPETKNTKDIITNPPFIKAKEFVEHSLEISEKGTKIAMFLKLTFLEGKKRFSLFKNYPPKYVYVFTSRIGCARGGDFSRIQNAVAYAWYIWEVGFKGDSIVRWIDNTNEKGEMK